MGEENIHNNKNAGFSLIELLVTILVSSMIFATASILMSIGLRQYQTVNAEVMLQTESQIAEFFITEQLQEATDFKKLSSSELVSGVTSAIQIKKGTDEYMLAYIGDELRFGKVSAGKTSTEQLTELKAKDKHETFLAQHITSFSFSAPDYTSVVDETTGNGFVIVGYKFEVLNKTYTSNSFIKLRNKTVN